MKLTKYEKETIILYNQAEDTARIHTHDADLKRRLAEYSQKHPDLCRLEEATAEGAMTYILDKSRLFVRLLPPFSEERRKQTSEFAKQHGFQSKQTDG